MASQATKPARGADTTTQPTGTEAEDAALGLASVRAGKVAILGDDEIAAKVASKSPPRPSELRRAAEEAKYGPGTAPRAPGDVAAVRRSDLWWVIDASAGEGTRTHEPVPGIKYALSADNWTSMPSAHAMVFLRDAAFQVKNAEGESMTALPSAADIRAHRKLDLQPGEIVAHIDELNTPALIARAVQFPGGARLRADTSREVALAFLAKAMLGARNAEKRGAGDSSTGSGAADAVLEDADDGFADAILGPRR